MGDTIALKGMDKGNTADVTAVKIADNAETGNEYLKPADGKRYVAVQFQIKPTGTKAYSDSPPGSTKVVDTEGQSYGPTFADTTAGPSFQTPATIAPGETGKGFVTFEVAAAAKLDKVQFAWTAASPTGPPSGRSADHRPVVLPELPRTVVGWPG